MQWVYDHRERRYRTRTESECHGGGRDTPSGETLHVPLAERMAMYRQTIIREDDCDGRDRFDAELYRGPE